MNFPLWVAFGALLAAMPAAQAQQPVRTPDPADPSAAVPATVYQSALAGYTPAPKDAPSPDKAWRAANDTVAGQPGHGAHGAHGAHSAPAPEPRTDEAPRQATPAAAPHAHRKHH